MSVLCVFQQAVYTRYKENYSQISNTIRSKSQSRFAAVFAQYIEAMC